MKLVIAFALAVLVCIADINGVSAASGVVKWFNEEKGFGFIVPDDCGDDVFVHFAAIEGTGYKTLNAGDRVEFDVSQGRKGLQASNVRPA